MVGGLTVLSLQVGGNAATASVSGNVHQATIDRIFGSAPIANELNYATAVTLDESIIAMLANSPTKKMKNRALSIAEVS